MALRPSMRFWQLMPSKAAQRLQEMFVDDAVDFTSLFTERADLVSFGKQLHLQWEDMETLEAAWNVARHDAEDELEGRMWQIAASSSDRSAAKPKSRPEVTGTAPKATPRLRPIVTDALTQFGDQVTLASSGQSARDVSGQEGDRMQAARDQLRYVYTQVADAGRRWIPPSEEFTEEQHRDHVQAFTRNIEDPQVILSPLRALRRWLQWRSRAAPRSPFWKPSEVVLGQFLREVSTGGPTAAKTVWNQLRWLEVDIGLPLPLDTVRAEAVQSAQHVVSAALELQPSEIWNIMRSFGQSSGPGGLVLSWQIAAIFACCRWKHLQRSCVMSADDNAVCGFCKRGKRRVQGTYPGFHFAIPKLNVLPLDFTGEWRHVYTQLASGQDQEV